MIHKAAIIPVPYEQTTSYGKGARYGPAAIISALGHVEDYDIEENKALDVSRIKILPALKNINNFRRLYEKIKKATRKVLESNRCLPVYLGGEHTITAAIVSAFKERFKNFTVLHFDAHSDMRDAYQGTKYSHACVMRRVWEMGAPIVSVGVRSQSHEENKFIAKAGARHAVPLHIFYAHQILKDKDWIKDVINHIGKNFYLSFDVDVMDPSCLPATGAPEPGGLYWQEVVDFFKALSKTKKRLIAMDIVELSPSKDSRPSDFLCAKLLYKILSLYIC